MKKKSLYFLYIVAVLGFCITLFIGMFLFDNNSGKEQLTNKPKIVEGNKINEELFEDLDSYISNNFGFRKYLIQGYALLKDKLFSTTGVDSVIVGKNDYLYYSETLDDYMGIITLNEREVFNIKRSLELMQEYVEKKGGKFTFIIAPNKNSLYDYMPSNYLKISDESNIDSLKGELKNINYVDLFEIFKKEDEELYYKLDSHWNKKGAKLVYNSVLDYIGKKHDDFSGYVEESTENVTGDIYKMLYPIGRKKDMDFRYGKENEYSYITKTRSVEQDYIETNNDNAEGSLLMFRDSFGNNLIEFFSNAYNKAIYDKTYPYNFFNMEKYNADDVIVEIVERNLHLLQENYPMFEAPIRENIEGKEVKLLVNTVEFNKTDEYMSIRGNIDEKYVDNNSKIYLKVNKIVYEMTPQTYKDNSYGFSGYIKNVSNRDKVSIIVESDNGTYESPISIVYN